MEPSEWSQVQEILKLAIEQPPDLRSRFVEERCSGDAVLRSKVDSLIDSYEKVGDFMEDGAIGGVADMFVPSPMDLASGDRLGRYEIVRLLGEGGMGKVYLADDLDLHRQVAIKVLRNDLWWYKQARQRLLREARAAARLDHPNICAIYEIEDTDERSFIVMQYVEGKTLADVMDHGGFGLHEAVRVALQIADALDEAHSRHIIHRDIKPANIIINEKGQAKVLDFGLAKSIEPKHEDKDLSNSGSVMGTVPYMSPEQLRGKTVDGRSDIFSFGALLYEMVSGRQVFGKESNAETISAILNDQPDLSVIPHRFRSLIGRSLKKRANDRYQRIGDLRAELRELEEATVSDSVQVEGSPNWFGTGSTISTAFKRYFSSWTGRAATSARGFYRWQDSDSNARTVRLTEPLPYSHTTQEHPVKFGDRPLLLAFGSLLILGVLPAAMFWFTRPSSDPHRYDSLRSVQLVSWNEAASSNYLGYSPSHNGKMLAYSSKQDGPYQGIYVKQLPEGGAGVPVTKDHWSNFSPIWSPDDQKLAFVSLRDGTYGIYTSPSLGGEATLVKTVSGGNISVRHWSNDGNAIFYELNGNLFRFDLATHDDRQLTSFESSPSTQRNFSFSTDESRIVYCDRTGGQTDLWVARTDGGDPTRITNDSDIENRAVWYPDGNRIIYSVIRDGRHQINVAYLDGQMPEQVTRGEGEHQLIDLTADGKNILYTTWEDRSDVWRVNVNDGKEEQVASGKESEFWSDISPDGKSILYQTNAATSPILSMPDSTISIHRLNDASTSSVVKGYDARWLGDSRHVAYLRWRGLEKRNAIWIVDTITGEESQVVDQSSGAPNYAGLPYNRFQIRDFSWSPDGSEVLYISKISDIPNVYRKSIVASEATVLSKNSDPSISFLCPLYSPDGKSIVYVSSRKSSLNGSQVISSVWLVEGGDSREIYSTPNGLRLLGWANDGNLIVEDVAAPLKANPTEVRLVSLSSTGASRIFTRLQDAYAPSATLSPDGKIIAFTARHSDRDDIFIISTNGGGLKKISSDNESRVYFGSLAWSPNGADIYYDKQERINTISTFENFR